jgi:hypothetical protein
MDYVFWDSILTRVTTGDVQFIVGKKLLLNAHNVGKHHYSSRDICRGQRGYS